MRSPPLLTVIWTDWRSGYKGMISSVCGLLSAAWLMNLVLMGAERLEGLRELIEFERVITGSSMKYTMMRV